MYPFHTCFVPKCHTVKCNPVLYTNTSLTVRSFMFHTEIRLDVVLASLLRREENKMYMAGLNMLQSCTAPCG